MCGLEIETRDGRVEAIRGDREDPLSRGYLCPKGAALGQLHEDPDRLRRPLARAGTSWRELDWDEALDRAAEGLVRVQRSGDDDALAVYVGNPAVHNHGTVIVAPAFLRALHTRHRYSATSIDQLPQMLVAFAMFGHQLLMPVPDIDRAEHLMIVGANPLVSNGSIMSAPDMRRRLRELRQRGGKLVVIDPRRSETAELADQHLFVRPGTDALVLLAMLHVILAEGRERLGRLLEFVDRLARVRVAVEPFTPQRAAGPSGIPAEQIRELAHELVERRGVVYGRVGAATQEFGSLTHWAIQVLNIVVGALDRPGGSMFPIPAVDPITLPGGVGPGAFGRWHSHVRGLPEFGGELPVATLAEDILAPEGTPSRAPAGSRALARIRGLLTIAGNPVLSSPAGSRLAEALEQLEFMVSVDPYVNETSVHADLILPPCSALERSHYDLAFHLFAVRNTTKYSPPVFERGVDQREDWQILHGLWTRIDRLRGRANVKQRLVHELLGRVGPDGVIDLGLRLGPHGRLLPFGKRGLNLAELRRHPHGIDLGPLEPCLPQRLPGPRKQIDLAPELLLRDLGRLERAFPIGWVEPPPPTPERPRFVLIGRRQLRSNNSWMHNLPKLMAGKPRCTLQMHPLDGERLALRPGDRVRVRGAAGEVVVELELSERMRPGVVSLPHGFGHARAGVRLRVASQPDNAGVSVNDLGDPERVDELSGVAAFSGVPVTVELVAP